MIVMTIIIKKIDSESFELDIKIPRVVSIKIDQKKLRQIDDLMRKTGYKNRSDLIRDAIDIYLKILEHTVSQSTLDKDRGSTGIEAIKEKILSKLAKQ
jgi:metal-responsive CopG/Arc/MetJ family transcriptional regulator